MPGGALTLKLVSGTCRDNDRWPDGKIREGDCDRGGCELLVDLSITC